MLDTFSMCAGANGESAAVHKTDLATAFVYGAIGKLLTDAREILSILAGGPRNWRLFWPIVISSRVACLSTW